MLELELISSGKTSLGISFEISWCEENSLLVKFPELLQADGFFSGTLFFVSETVELWKLIFEEDPELFLFCESSKGWILIFDED